MRVTRLSGSEGGGILCDSPYPYSDYEVWSNFGAAQGRRGTRKRNRSNDLD